MAFIASLDHLPSARESWKTKKPKPPVPPVQPPPQPPKPKPKPSHHCTDGYERVKVYQFGIFMGWTCDKIKYKSPVEQQVEAQITGIKIPLVQPSVLYADRRVTAEHRPSGYVDTKVSQYVTEDIEG